MSKPFDALALEKIDSPEATAAAYFSIFRSPKATAQDYQDFESWHARDEANRIAWAKVEHSWDGSGAMRADARILEIRERALANRRGRKAWARPAIAACAVLAVLGGGIAFQRQRDAVGAALAVTDSRVISTGVGQQGTFRMTDGSIVTANTATVLTVAESDTGRSTAIRDGEAFFEVAKNPRKPFVVTAGGLTVTALGTQFAVREAQGKVDVTLAEGRVRVDMPAINGHAAQSTVLQPGQELAWDGQGYRTGAVEVERRLAWRKGIVDFDRVPLAQAVAEINRYSPQEIIISSPTLGRRPISGTFRIGVTRGFLQSLEAAGIARVENESATRAELVAP
ncbi:MULTISPECIES: FecR domain-containing protein [unclassified Novosphingobium]|uniref:FecR family protein n=1 Tax=unclassified Novosphingobium TaxID=2644732 RepID=UPI00135CD6A5|nr:MULTISPECIES: FecR domain-containing protein [unclassified Novosphingobium]